MAANKILNIEPIAVPNSIGNLLNCAITALTGPIGITATQPYMLIRHIRAMNRTAGAITLTLYKGATGGSAAGTEFGFAAYSLPPNQAQDVYFSNARFDSTDFLTGVGSGTGITLNIEGEIGFS